MRILLSKFPQKQYSLYSSAAKMSLVRIFSGNQTGTRLLITLSTNLGLAGLGIITGSITARLLGPTGRGELAAIQNWPALFVTFGSLGLPQAVVYYCGKEPQKDGRDLATAGIFLLFTSSILIGIGYLLMPYFLAAQSPSVVHGARIYLIFIPLSLLIGIPAYLLQGKNDLVVWNFVRILPSVGWLFTLISAVIIGIYSSNQLVTIYLFILASLLFPVWWIVVHRLQVPLALDWGRIKPLLKFGLPSAFANIPSVLNLRVDQLVMAAFLGPQVLGFYVAAVAWSSALNPILASIANITFPRLANISDEQIRSTVFAKTIRLSILLTLGLVLFLISITPYGIYFLFGPKFSSAIPAAFILVVAAGIAGVNYILEDALRGSGYPLQVLIAEALGLCVTVILLILLLSRFQLIGAAIASISSYLVTFVLLIRLSASKLKISIVNLLLPKMEDIKQLISIGSDETV